MINLLIGYVPWMDDWVVDWGVHQAFGYPYYYMRTLSDIVGN